MKRATVAAVALPVLALGDRFDGIGIGGDAEGEMGRAIAARRLFDKAAADLTAGFELGARRVDLDPRAVLVELERKEAARIGRKRHRDTAHELRQDAGDVLRVARGDG